MLSSGADVSNGSLEAFEQALGGTGLRLEENPMQGSASRPEHPL
jgi:hypothetical protein